MAKRYILTGDPKELAKVIRENRIRINRGVISITPVEPETDADYPEDVPNADDKNIGFEDMKEVDLGDDKTVVAEDSKDVPEDDSKDSDSGKTSKRNKKPE